MIVDDPDKKALRLNRFKDMLLIDTALEDVSEQPRLESPKKLKGRCNKLEKSYLRLTSAPDPAVVRPLKILKAALEMVKESYLANDDYSYACDQLKSIRQDITVQCIRGRFAAHVYETHARIALESGDLPEYNQCQSQLQEMRRKGVLISVDEFDCYRILYSIHIDSMLDLAVVMREIEFARKDGFSSNQLSISKQRTIQNINTTATSFALEVLASVRQNNTNRFFCLNSIAPLHAGYIMDFILSKQRVTALRTFLRAFLHISLRDLSGWLQFKTERSCEKFLQQQGCCVDADLSGATAVKVIDCKKCLSAESSTIVHGSCTKREGDTTENVNDSISTRPLSASRHQHSSTKDRKEKKKKSRKFISSEKDSSRKRVKISSAAAEFFLS